MKMWEYVKGKVSRKKEISKMKERNDEIENKIRKGGH